MTDHKKSSLTVRDVTLFGVLGSLTFCAKFVMASLPNIEPVSLMVMIFGAVFQKKAVYPIAIYVMLEYLVYGLNYWSISYLYVWAILAIVSYSLRRMNNPIGWAILSGVFGLLFGALCAPVYLLTGGIGFAVSWWISGIPYDILHCIGNFCIALVAFVPLRKLTSYLYHL